MADSYVAVVNVRDDFFNDPFFKDWWSDFEGPVSVLDGPGKWITLVRLLIQIEKYECNTPFYIFFGVSGVK